MDKLRSLAKNVEIFQNVWIIVLDKCGPKKRKYLRAKPANFMNTALNHAIKVLAKLRHIYLKSRSNKDRKAYKK